MTDLSKSEQELRERLACCIDCHEDHPCIAGLLSIIRSHVNASVGAAVEACAKACIGYGHICNNKGCHAADAAAIGQISDFAADEAIECIHDEAHEVALSLAAEQIIGALREGGNFAEGSPLAKVMQAIERIKREAEILGRKFMYHLWEQAFRTAADPEEEERGFIAARAALSGKETEHD